MAPRLPERIQFVVSRLANHMPDWLVRDPRISSPEMPYQQTSHDYTIVKNLGQSALQAKHD